MTGVTDAADVPTAAGVRLRPYRREDAPRIIDIGDRISPNRRGSLESFLFHDEHWDTARYFRLRLMAETVDGTVAGWGQVTHMPWQYDADKYALEIAVDPDHQRHGIGGAVYARLLAELDRRGARLVRSGTRESRPEAVAFLERRGFREVQRYWESRLDVTAFDPSPFDGAESRAAGQGVVITTLAAERGRRPEAELLREVYELESACLRDVPAPDPVTPSPFDEFLRHEIGGPGMLPEAWFLARLEGAAPPPGGAPATGPYVGLSVLSRRLSEPGVLGQGLTGALPAYRGRGIAMALKLTGLRYAREHGYREIRTTNNTRNRPMLRINEAMGFVKQPADIEYERPLRGA